VGRQPGGYVIGDADEDEEEVGDDEADDEDRRDVVKGHVGVTGQREYDE